MSAIIPTSPGVYPHVRMDEYLAMPAVSASVLKVLVAECPRAAWWQSWMNPQPAADDSTDASNAGSIAHMILLEGHQDGVMVIDPLDYPAEKTGNIPDGWTNKAIRAARDAAIGFGKIPVLKPAMGETNAMVSEARRFLDEEVRPVEPAIWQAFQPDGGESETTIVWQDGETLCRIRPDRLSTDRKLVIDYKTGGTTSEPDTWGRVQMVRMGYYMSAAFYARGIEETFGVQPAYVFLVQEQAPPYLCSLVGMDPHAFELGAAKINFALDLWRRCVKTNRWPGYPGRVVYPELPAWEQANWEEREAIEEHEGKMLKAGDFDAGIPL